jgi:uncharacterized protein
MRVRLNTDERGEPGDRIESFDGVGLARDLNGYGNAVVAELLTEQECRSVAAMYEEAGAFRSRVVMGRHGFGRGEYQYFKYPLPPIIGELRTALYARLAPVANSWNEAMGIGIRYPATHGEFLERCHAAGQQRPTPLLLQYAAGDYNCLHQDLYGEHVFPIQVAILLSRPGADFTGGEFVLTEQRPRMQSRPEVSGIPSALFFTMRPDAPQGQSRP